MMSRPLHPPLVKAIVTHPLCVICRTYTSWDAYIATNQLISNIIMMRTLYKALADLSVLKHTWHMHVIILSNLLTCGAHLTFIMR